MKAASTVISSHYLLFMSYFLRDLWTLNDCVSQEFFQNPDLFSEQMPDFLGGWPQPHHL